VNATDFCTEDGPCWFHAENRNNADEPCPGNFKTKQATWERERIRGEIKAALARHRPPATVEEDNDRFSSFFTAAVADALDPYKIRKGRRARRR